MKRFLNTASKALAVVGVLMLMWTASEMQPAKAAPAESPCDPIVVPSGPQQGWFTCSGTKCAVGKPPKCCQVPTYTGSGDANKIENYTCCLNALVPCPAVVSQRVIADCQNYPVTRHMTSLHAGLHTLVKAFQCPADDRQQYRHRTSHGDVVAVTGYLGVSGLGSDPYIWKSGLQRSGVIYSGSRTRVTDITYGTANTLLFGERPPSPDYECGWWYTFSALTIGRPYLPVRGQRGYAGWNYNLPAYNACPPGPYPYTSGDINNICDANHFWSVHTGGANFAFCDGSVKFLKYSADAIPPALATRAGGEVVEAP